MDSLDEKLEQQVTHEVDSDACSFAVLFLHVMRIIRTVSVDRFAKARKISDCAHENVEDLCNDCIDDHRELLAAKARDEESTMHMLDTIGTAGGRSGDDMKSEIRPIRKKLHAALLTTRWMKPEDRAAHMVSAGVDVMTILNELKEECRRLCDGDKWGPAKNMSDKKTLSKNFGSVNKAETGMDCRLEVARERSTRSAVIRAAIVRANPTDSDQASQVKAREEAAAMRAARHLTSLHLQDQTFPRP